MTAWTLPAALTVLLLLGSGWAARSRDKPAEAGGKKKPGGTRNLGRSEGKRWERLAEFVKAEIKTSTKKFLENRGTVSVGWLLITAGQPLALVGRSACM